MTNMTQPSYYIQNTDTLYMAMELSNKTWLLAFSNGVDKRLISIPANELETLEKEIAKARKKFNLKGNSQILSCYEAGRDGFWIHRYLTKIGVKNVVIDSSSIETNRRKKRAKTDKLDAESLLRQLILYYQGNARLSIVRVPSKEQEAKRRLHRQREKLVSARTRGINRIKALLKLQGIKYKRSERTPWEDYFAKLVDWEGKPLDEKVLVELKNEAKQLQLIKEQIAGLEQTMDEKRREGSEEVYKQVATLFLIKGIGKIGAWTLIVEWLGWRTFNNVKELSSASGLVGAPYNSGDSYREQGITKAGNKRIRRIMIQLAWCWLKYQPNSELSLWFNRRFSQTSRSRKIGIVALARKLLVMLWKYVTTGVLPADVTLKAA